MKWRRQRQLDPPRLLHPHAIGATCRFTVSGTSSPHAATTTPRISPPTPNFLLLSPSRDANSVQWSGSSKVRGQKRINSSDPLSFIYSSSICGRNVSVIDFTLVLLVVGPSEGSVRVGSGFISQVAAAAAALQERAAAPLRRSVPRAAD